jgi:predicted DNA-binding transcriptional regulator AlpA
MAHKERKHMPAAQAVRAPRLLRASEVASMLGVSPWRVHQLAAEGVLQPVRLGKRGWARFRVEDVEALIHGDTQESSP